MRSAVLGLLAVVIPGCNSWFGLDPTVLADGGIGGIDAIDAPEIPIARLTWLVAETDTDGRPVALPALPPLTAPPTLLQVGTITGPLANVSYRADGAVELPLDLPREPWRLVFQVAGGLPHEVQWAPPADRIAHMTIPMFGRLDRIEIPAPSSGVSVTPVGSPSSHTSPRIYTTGVWSELALTNIASPTVTFGMTATVPFSGPPGAPEPQRGDRFVVLDTATGLGSGCRVSSGATDFAVTLTTSTVVPSPQPTWTTVPRGVIVDLPVSGLGRLTGVFDVTALQRRWLYGRAPSTAMPAFTRSVLGSPLLAPAMMTALDCNGDTANEAVVESTAMQNFAGLGYAQFTTSRTIMGTATTLTSGVAAATPATGTTYSLDTSVAIPVAFTLGGVGLNGDDHVQLPAGEHLVLDIELDGAPGTGADYFDVVLHRVTGSLQPVRVYRVTAPEVTIDARVFADDPAGTEYVLEVRAFRGAPAATLGDFTTYEPTQSYASVFTRTFVKP